tara:strand:- start:28 stop:351 length:324 start_codon:yes stop_codon:yes gene_type:complete
VIDLSVVLPVRAGRILSVVDSAAVGISDARREMVVEFSVLVPPAVLHRTVLALTVTDTVVAVTDMAPQIDEEILVVQQFYSRHTMKEEAEDYPNRILSTMIEASSNR